MGPERTREACEKMSQKRVAVLVTDLDNTLFDWFDFWYHSFSLFLESLERLSGVSRDVLIEDVRRVHLKHGTSEYAFLLQEMPSLQQLHPGQDVVALYDDAIHAYRRARKKHLRLYPGVKETLNALKSEGVLLVAFTESTAFYAQDRLIRLELDGIIDRLYSPADHELPGNVESLRKLGPERYKLRFTAHHFTPPNATKPNPDILLSIVDQAHASPDDVVYVGDSLARDIVMAKKAGVTDVYAKYGAASSREGYELLKAVSHWTQDRVDREVGYCESAIRPSFCLANSFSELLSIQGFTFSGHRHDSVPNS
jgi:phosphoglycolate phosphatase-like HAD superfamily hydrolase